MKISVNLEESFPSTPPGRDFLQAAGPVNPEQMSLHESSRSCRWEGAPPEVRRKGNLRYESPCPIPLGILLWLLDLYFAKTM